MAAVAVTAALVAPSGAHATSCEAPPGTAGIDQYCETIPSTTGDRGAGDPHGGRGVPPATRTFLARHGAGVVVQLAEPSGSRRRARDEGSQPSTGADVTPSGGTRDRQASRNPLNAVRAAVTSGDTVGAGLPWALLAVVLGFAGAGWVRYRAVAARD
jgi:hypothetical protein